MCKMGTSLGHIFRSSKILGNSVISETVIPRAKYATEASFETTPFKLHMLEEGPSTKSTLSKVEALELFKDMTAIRMMENRFNQMYLQKLIRGFLHLYSGEEAVAVGIKSVLKPEDHIITAYRCHGWVFLCTRAMEGIFAELTGRVNGLSKGRGGSMHMFGKNFYGGNGIVGAQVPVGSGVALAIKLRGKEKDSVCVTLYGDGAANQGQVFESFNIAKLKNLPCIYVCENNHYGMGTSDKRSSASTAFHKRVSYMPGIRADGMDIFAMREVTKFARKFCTEGKGPIVIEANTYRYFGHSMSDPGVSYRSREEIKKVRDENDPINNFQKKILDKGLVTQEELDKVRKEAEAVINTATKVSVAGRIPRPDELGFGVYCKNLTKTCRNVNLWNPLKPESGECINLK